MALGVLDAGGCGAIMLDNERQAMRNIYIEILDVLEVRKEYLERTRGHVDPVCSKVRLSELQVVRSIINTLNEGDKNEQI